MTKVLLVDDDGDQLVIVQATLEKKGYSVKSTDRAKSALAMLAKESFDLIISDIRLPEMDGVAFTKTIRASKGTSKDIPIVLFTAGAEDRRDEALAAGASELFAKDNLRELLAYISSIPGTSAKPA